MLFALLCKKIAFQVCFSKHCNSGVFCSHLREIHLSKLEFFITENVKNTVQGLSTTSQDRTA